MALALEAQVRSMTVPLRVTIGGSFIFIWACFI